MRAKTLIQSLLLLAAGLLVSCNLDTDDATPTSTPLPPCDPADLQQAGLVEPSALAIVDSLLPSFSWLYPEADCLPESYRSSIRQGPGYETAGWQAEVAGEVTSWTPDSPLPAGSVFAWSVEASAGGGWSDPATRRFFTGPLCTAAELAVPILLYPADGSLVTGSVDLMWDNPSPCLVDGYRVQFAADPDFTDLVFDASYPIPFQRLILDETEAVACTTYYWKMAALLDGAESAFSAPASFFYDPRGGCMLPASPGEMHGKVYHDLCALFDGPLPDPLPEGCVTEPGGAAGANGTYEFGEPGIPGVVVRLGDGACPSVNRGAVLTNEFGDFTFLELEPGNYCLSIDSLDTNNVEILIPGGWTAPASGVGEQLATRQVTLTEAGLSGLEYAWDYQFLPVYGAPGTISGAVWNDRCSYPELGPLPDPLPEGCLINEWGELSADAVRAVDEPGIAGLVVDLGIGDCPSAGYMVTLTDENGEYSFEGVPPGDYCLRINAEDESNLPILLSGHWTVVPSGHMGMTFRSLSLAAGGSVPSQNFAWDYDLPHFYGWIPLFYTEVATNCRTGPGGDYPVAAILEARQIFPVLGINPEITWGYLLIPPDPLDLPDDPLDMPDEPLDMPDEPLDVPRGLVMMPEISVTELPFPFQVAESPLSFLQLDSILMPGDPFERQRCWANLDVGQAGGGVAELPVVPSAPPPSTADEPPPDGGGTSVACSSITSASKCWSSGCKWIPKMICPFCGTCVNP